MPESCYTAKQIADAARLNVRDVRQRLANLEPRQKVLVQGQLTDAWALADFPSSIRHRLDKNVERFDYPDLERLLDFPHEQWSPEIPFAKIKPAQREKAGQLAQALAPLLNASAATSSISDLVTLARVQLPQTASNSTTRRIIERAIGRDRGAGEFDRPELYLPNSLTAAKVKQSAAPSKIPAKKLCDTERRLRMLIDSQPSQDAIIWDTAFQEAQALIDGGQPAAAVKNSIAGVLWNHTELAKSESALRRNFNRKFSAWREAGQNVVALKDRRADNAGRPAPELSPEIESKIIARALNCGGRLSQAWRELLNDDALPPVFSEFYGLSTKKSQVPHRIRDRLAPQIARLKAEHIGPREGQLRGPKVDRDWSGMPSGVQAQSDDCTLPVYFWIPDENGLPVTDPDNGNKVLMTRGQFLPWIDTRTGFIYCFQLLPKPSYSSQDIMRGVIHLHDEYGLPEELYFERGIWERSLLISGRQSDMPSLADRAFGLADLGIKVIHALDPSAKIVERVLGSLQNWMERERGYCGRDERRDCPEQVAKALREVRNGKAHPPQYFYSYQEWMQRLVAICNAYNDEPQQGKRLQGMSPRQAYYKYLESPMVQLGEARYLLANHRREVTVSPHGVRISIGQNKFLYTSEATGRLQGQRVLAWYDLEDNSHITITDLKGRNPVNVPLSTVPAWRATDEELSQAIGQKNAHRRAIKQQYRSLKKDHPEEFAHRQKRAVVTDPETAELGREIEAQREAAKAAERQQARQQRLIRDNANRFGLPVNTSPRNDRNRQARGAELLGEALKNINSKDKDE